MSSSKDDKKADTVKKCLSYFRVHVVKWSSYYVRNLKLNVKSLWNCVVLSVYPSAMLLQVSANKLCKTSKPAVLWTFVTMARIQDSEIHYPVIMKSIMVSIIGRYLYFSIIIRFKTKVKIKFNG